MTMPFSPDAIDPRILTSLGMPASPQAQAQMAKPSLWNRLQEAFAPAPTEYGDLVGEKDVKSARNQALLQAGLQMLQASGPSTQHTNFAQILGGGLQAGMGGYRNAIDQRVQGVAAKQGIDLNRMKMDSFKAEQAKLAQLSAVRKAVIGELGSPDPKDPQGMSRWIEQALPKFIEAGDDEMVQRLSAIRSTLGNGQGQQPHFDTLNTGGEMVDRMIMPDGTIKVLQTTPRTPPPRDPNSADPQAGLAAQRMFTRENQLGDDYRMETKQHTEVAAHYDTIRANAAEAKSGNPAANIGLIFSFMKLQDPGSTVREGEYATAQNAAGIPDRVRNQYNKVLDGNFLTPEQIDHFVQGGRVVAQAWQRRLKNRRTSYQNRAKQWGVSESIFSDPFDGMDLEAPAAKPPLTSFKFGGAAPNPVAGRSAWEMK